MKLDLPDIAFGALGCEGPRLIMGGPGSGKTTLALLCAKHMVPQLMPGQKILFISFSRAAVRQVTLRCGDILSRDEKASIEIKTYHAYCLDLIRTHGALLTGAPPKILFPGSEKLQKASFDGDWNAEKLAQERQGVYSFDRFAATATDLLNRSEAISALNADRYPVILIDEFQDTDDDQWALVQTLEAGSTLIYLADPDQHIFDFNDRFDSKRLDHLREKFAPPEFDLGEDNHRSPASRILTFANAVLKNEALPETDDVDELYFWDNEFKAVLHYSVRRLQTALTIDGSDPTIAILTRSNKVVAEISSGLLQEISIGGRLSPPIVHDIQLDAELTSAAALVVASVLEWTPEKAPDLCAAVTLEAVADYFEMKSAAATSPPVKSADDASLRFRKNGTKIREGKKCLGKTPPGILEWARSGQEFTGDPRSDWITVRDRFGAFSDLGEIALNVRFVRLLGTTEEIGFKLAEMWKRTGTYGDARRSVKKTLDQSILLADFREPKGVTVMTLHKSKGKEFDAVILVEKRFGSKFFTSDEDYEAAGSASRRLLRVGLTRARREALLIRPQRAVPLISSPSEAD